MLPLAALTLPLVPRHTQRHLRPYSRAAQPEREGRRRCRAAGQRKTLHLLLGIENGHIHAAHVSGFSRLAARNEGSHGNYGSHSPERVKWGNSRWGLILHLITGPANKFPDYSP